MRNISITVSDSGPNEVRHAITAEITVDSLNQLYRSTGINGLTTVLLTANSELNDLMNSDVEIIIPILNT